MVRKYLVFTLNSEIYGALLADVKEVISLPTLVKVPETPRFVLGLINLRGKVISAIDVKQKLGLEGGKPPKRVPVVLVDSSDSTSGCLVDSVVEVLLIDDSRITVSPKDAGTLNKNFYAGTVRLPDRPMILLLNLKTVVDDSRYLKAS